MEKTYDCVILASGDYPSHPIACEVLEHAKNVICCDGAAQEYIRRGRLPLAIVGDGDSLPRAIKEQYAELVHTVKEQEYNDLTKATRYAFEQGFKNIAFLGCTGKREDHTLGNISLLTYYQRVFQIHPIMITDHGFFTPAVGTRTFSSFAKQQVSIFRLSGKEFASEGLRWASYPYEEWWQGTLNEALANSFTIYSDGTYIIYQTYEGKRDE